MIVLRACTLTIIQACTMTIARDFWGAQPPRSRRVSRAVRPINTPNIEGATRRSKGVREAAGLPNIEEGATKGNKEVWGGAMPLIWEGSTTVGKRVLRALGPATPKYKTVRGAPVWPKPYYGYKINTAVY